MAKSHTFRKTKPGKPIHFDIKEKIFGTDDLSPLFSVIYNKKESCDGSNSGVVNHAEQFSKPHLLWQKPYIMEHLTYIFASLLQQRER